MELVAGPFAELHTSAILCVRFLSADRHIVSASEDCIICVWDAHNGTIIEGPFEFHWGGNRKLTCAALSPGGVLAAAHKWDNGNIHIYSVVDGALAHDRLVSNGIVISLAWSSDSTKLASTYNLGLSAILIWDRHSPSKTSPALTGAWEAKGKWLVNTRLDLSFLILADIIRNSPTARNPLTIDTRGSCIVDYSNVLIGDRWHECYIDS